MTATYIRPRPYDRNRDLPKLMPIWPHELDTPTPEAHAALIAKLERMLRAERQRGLANDWTYDLPRHTQLMACYKAEVAALKSRS